MTFCSQRCACITRADITLSLIHIYIVARKKVASEPVLRDWTAVDVALRDLKECQYALTELGVELDRRIDGLKDDYNKNAQPLQNRIKRLEGDEMCIRDRIYSYYTWISENRKQ